MLYYAPMRLLTGILSTTLVVINVALNCVPLFIMALIRGLLRLLNLKAAEARFARLMDRIIDSFVVCNRMMFSMLSLTRLQVRWEGDEGLSRERWYMVVSNHQTWTDILALQVTLHGRIPPLKFFTKRQLLWLPLIGTAMWVLGFPYVRRMSRNQIENNPALLEVDRKAILEACEGFKSHPTTALNFLEGTRYTADKHAAQDGRFRHLLNPKVGGLTQVIAALDDRLDKLLDVTIIYPAGVPTFWEFMQGLCPEIQLEIRCHDLPAEIRSAAEYEERRYQVTSYIDTLWQAKDQRLHQALEGSH